MSDLAFTDEESQGHGARDCAPDPVSERTPWRRAEVAPGLTVERALPVRRRRTVGAWCFLDLASPVDPLRGTPLDVGPHPHIGLQTLTWVFSGRVVHRDSLGHHQSIRPHQVNLMTSGGGIAHSEHSPSAPTAAELHLAQLWVALPDSARHAAASFAHHPEVPIVDEAGVSIRVVVGEHDGVASPAVMHSGIVGLDVELVAGASATLPLNAEFEYAVVVVAGSARVAGESLAPGELLYLGRHRRDLAISSDTAAHVLVLGGEPFGEDILMWWNFVARTRDEIEAARQDWMRDAGLIEGTATGRFLPIPGDSGSPIPAPPIPWKGHA